MPKHISLVFTTAPQGIIVSPVTDDGPSCPKSGPGPTVPKSLGSLLDSWVPVLDLLNQNMHFIYLCFPFLGPHLWHMGVPRARGPIRAPAVAYATATGNTGSEPQLRPTLQLVAAAGSLTHQATMGTPAHAF